MLPQTTTSITRIPHFRRAHLLTYFQIPYPSFQNLRAPFRTVHAFRFRLGGWPASDLLLSDECTSCSLWPWPGACAFPGPCAAARIAPKLGPCATYRPPGRGGKPAWRPGVAMDVSFDAGAIACVCEGGFGGKPLEPEPEAR